MKRFIDTIIAVIALMVFTPILILCAFLIWLQDFKNPIYVSQRIGQNFVKFKMFKLRTMISNAELFGGESTSNNDKRITSIGLLIRKWKLDELTQLFNVLYGNMSVVGPRPNTANECSKYDCFEKRLLKVRPGITDAASIIFSNEGEILARHKKPDEAYNYLIRPWKSKLGVWYVDNHSTGLDLQLTFLTVLALLSRPAALNILAFVMTRMNAPKELISFVKIKASKEDLVY